MELFFDNSLATGYKSHCQIARRLTENWVERNMFCPVCGNPVLTHYENNKPVADFYCEHCHSDFELKSKECRTGVLGKKINDGAYDTMISRIKSYNNPNFFFFTEELQQRHPSNSFVQPKIRQQLQCLRDKGYIEFLGRGHYRKRQ